MVAIQSLLRANRFITDFLSNAAPFCAAKKRTIDAPRALHCGVDLPLLQVFVHKLTLLIKSNNRFSNDVDLVGVQRIPSNEQSVDCAICAQHVTTRVIQRYGALEIELSTFEARKPRNKFGRNWIFCELTSRHLVFTCSDNAGQIISSVSHGKVHGLRKSNGSCDPFQMPIDLFVVPLPPRNRNSNQDRRNRTNRLRPCCVVAVMYGGRAEEMRHTDKERCHA